LDGGNPVREEMLPYGTQWIDEDDIAAVVDVLRSDWLTTGPKVPEFEKVFAQKVGAAEAVAVSNGTAALHASMFALGIGKGDEVIVTPMTFAASANCVLYQGGTPVFADVEPDSLLLDPSAVEAAITPRTKAIVAVDFAGHPCEYDKLQDLASRHGLALVADACHALGGSYRGTAVGTLADLSVFSFHPVKHITSGEGGMITTNDADLASHMRRFRSHGISSDFRQRDKVGSWFYEMVDLGYNYRLTDIQCALGISQISKLHAFVERRQEIASTYDKAFALLEFVSPLSKADDVSHAYHLYILRFDTAALGKDRAKIYAELRAENIGVNVHYIPVHLHPYYRERLGTEPGLCPVAEAAYEEIISLPMFPKMADSDAQDVITAVNKIAFRGDYN